MAIEVKRIVPSSSGKTAKPMIQKPKLELKLQTELNEPPQELRHYSLLIYGEKKIGKTTLAARFPGAYFLSTEPGVKALKVLSSRITKWDELVGYLKLIEDKNDPNLTVVVDTIDLAYEMLFDMICREKGIEHPNEEKDYGETWRQIKRAFRKVVDRLCALPGGCVLLSHDTDKEIVLRNGETVERTQPTMAKQALGEVEGAMDFIGCYQYDDLDRVLVVSGNQRLVAGRRLGENNDFFKTPKGEDVTQIPMGTTSLEGYNNLLRAFRNQQATPTGAASKTPALKVLVKKVK
jgi:hypothetical protein